MVKESFMAISVRNAFRAGSSDSLDDLRETIASLESQVTSLYEEKEAAGLSSGGGDQDGLVALYEQKVALSHRTVAALQTALASFEEQLAALYDDKAEAGDSSVVIEGLEAQLHALYQEREEQELVVQPGASDTSALMATIHSFEEQLASMYEAQASHEHGVVEAHLMVASLEPQLAALLDERDDLAAALQDKTAELERSRSKAKEMVAALMEQAMR
jgi:chromosome segregation ATPase